MATVPSIDTDRHLAVLNTTINTDASQYNVDPTKPTHATHDQEACSALLSFGISPPVPASRSTHSESEGPTSCPSSPERPLAVPVIHRDVTRKTPVSVCVANMPTVRAAEPAARPTHEIVAPQHISPPTSQYTHRHDAMHALAAHSKRTHAHIVPQPRAVAPAPHGWFLDSHSNVASAMPTPFAPYASPAMVAQQWASVPMPHHMLAPTTSLAHTPPMQWGPFTTQQQDATQYLASPAAVPGTYPVVHSMMPHAHTMRAAAVAETGPWVHAMPTQHPSYSVTGPVVPQQLIQAYSSYPAPDAASLNPLVYAPRFQHVPHSAMSMFTPQPVPQQQTISHNVEQQPSWSARSVDWAVVPDTVPYYQSVVSVPSQRAPQAAECLARQVVCDTRMSTEDRSTVPVSPKRTATTFAEYAEYMLRTNHVAPRRNAKKQITIYDR